MIAKLERTQSTAQQNKDPAQNPHTHTHNGSNNKQRTNNSSVTALELTATKAARGGVLKLITLVKSSP